MVRLFLWKSDTAAASQPHLFAVRQRAAHPWRVRADLPRLRRVITTAKVEVSVETEFWINCFSVCSFCRQKRRLVVKLFRLLTTDTVLWPRRQCSVLSAVWVGLQSMSRLRQKTCSSWSNRWVEPHRPTVWAIEQEAASPSGSAGISSLEEKHRLPYWFQSKTQNRKRSILRVGTTPTLCRSERHALKCQRES